MKEVKTTLWVSDGDYGQRSRPVVIACSVCPMGSGKLYLVHSITDVHSKAQYPVALTLPLNSCMDEIIAAADPQQVEFARRELGVKLGAKMSPKKPAKLPPKPSEKDLWDDL